MNLSKICDKFSKKKNCNQFYFVNTLKLTIEPEKSLLAL